MNLHSLLAVANPRPLPAPRVKGSRPWQDEKSQPPCRRHRSSAIRVVNGESHMLTRNGGLPPRRRMGYPRRGRCERSGEDTLMSLVDVFRAVRPAVVPVGTRINNNPYIIGTGFNVDPSGIVITCRHVVNGLLLEAVPNLVVPPGERFGRALLKTHPLFVMFHELQGREIVVEGVPPVVIFGPTKWDAAVIMLPTRPEGYPALDLADSDEVLEGEGIAACGFPLGLALEENAISGTATFQGGIISAVLPHPDIGPGHRVCLQLDLTFNPGNSGGPVFLQESGRVVGIAWTRLGRESPTGLSYAVPINVVKPYIARLKENPDQLVQALRRGELPEGWDVSYP